MSDGGDLAGGLFGGILALGMLGIGAKMIGNMTRDDDDRDSRRRRKKKSLNVGRHNIDVKMPKLKI